LRQRSGGERSGQGDEAKPADDGSAIAGPKADKATIAARVSAFALWCMHMRRVYSICGNSVMQRNGSKANVGNNYRDAIQAVAAHSSIL
jgi:hypothetical protein